MALTFRWLLRLFLAIVLLVALGLMIVYYLASRSVVDYNRSFSLAGIAAPVEIVRDNHNVPHIYGETDRDSFFGLGFVHAQDRLWQMTMMRRAAQGRLSEIFGARAYETDEFLRRVDLYRLAEDAVPYQGLEEQLALQSYADGVNAWIEIIRSEALGRGAPEFFLFPSEIQAWKPADSIALMKLMSLKLSGQLGAEILRARTSLALGDRQERLLDILSDAPGPGAAALPAFGAMFDDLPVLAQSEPAPFLSPVPKPAFAGASNAWAAGPSRTTSQAPLLANDPHMELTAPSIWMLARIALKSGDVIGTTIPGIPAILSGRSDRLAWGITSSYLDDQDLHIEEINPQNPDQYRTPNGWRDFETRPAVIRIKDQTPRTIVLKFTENGPVIPPHLQGVGAITPSGNVASLNWVALEPEDTSITAAIRLMMAPDVFGAIKAGEDFVAPSQNLTLIDRKNIAFQMIGKMPARDADHDSLGRLPSRGWKVQNRWAGYLPYENNPRIINPAGGLVANTNNKSVDRPFPDHVSFVWGDTQRIERLQKLLGSRKVHTRASFIEAQLDQVSFSARALLPLIARDLWFSGDIPAPGSREALRASALALLAEWNGEMNEHLPEPLIFAAWMRSLQLMLIKDDIGVLTPEFSNPDPVFLERVFRNIDGASEWCDVRQSTPVETCTEIARIALDTALAGLAQEHGPRVESWRWGDAHQATHDHEVLGDIPLLAWFLNIRQSTSGGDNTLMRGKTAGTGENPFLNVHAAGYRAVYDLADPDSSVFIISTGQSGHFLSRYYDDLAQLWRRGEYIPMSLDRVLARAASVGVTVLTPKNR